MWTPFNDGGAVDEDYYRKQITLVDERLALAGLRLAAMLNEVLGHVLTQAAFAKANDSFAQSANLNTTADVYTHTSAEDERKAALALERAIYGNLFQTVPETANKNSRAATRLEEMNGSTRNCKKKGRFRV